MNDEIVEMALEDVEFVVGAGIDIEPAQVSTKIYPEIDNDPPP